MNNIIQRNGNKQYAIQWPLVRKIRNNDIIGKLVGVSE